MLQKIIGSAISSLITVLLAVFPKDEIKKLIDGLLDKVEDMIKASPTAYDDAALLPLINLLRGVFDIPDND